MGVDPRGVIADEAALRAVIGEPNDVVPTKIAATLNRHTRRFVELSTFHLVATSAADGTCDVTPRGDPPGSARILDERTLLLPERPGNRLADALRNILENPHVGLLFLVPGVTDTLRVNGRATIVTDEELLAPCAVEGKIPKLGLLVDVAEVYTHCSKAFLGAQLWDPGRHVDRSALPTNGEIMASLNETIDAETYEAERTSRYARREGFY
jgi:uncharacterized protein